jgi:hypothetical protein
MALLSWDTPGRVAWPETLPVARSAVMIIITKLARGKGLFISICFVFDNSDSLQHIKIITQSLC